MNGESPGMFSFWPSPPDGDTHASAEQNGAAKHGFPFWASHPDGNGHRQQENGAATNGFSFWPSQPNSADSVHQNGDSDTGFSFWPSESDTKANAPLPASSQAEQEDSSASFVNDLLGMTQKWCCATKNSTTWMYAADANPEQNEASHNPTPSRLTSSNGHADFPKQSPRFIESPRQFDSPRPPATFKHARNQRKLIEGVMNLEEGDGSARSPPLQEQQPPSQTLMGKIASEWHGLGMSPPLAEVEEQNGTAQHAEDEQRAGAGSAVPEETAPQAQRSVQMIGARGLEPSPGSAFHAVTSAGSGIAKVGFANTFHERRTSDRSSDAAGSQSPIKRSQSSNLDDHKAEAEHGNGANGDSRAEAGFQQRLKSIQINANRDLAPIGDKLLTPDKKIEKLPFSRSRRRNTIAVSNTYTEVHHDVETPEPHQTMEQHGKTGSRAPDHDEPSHRHVRHKIMLTLIEEKGDARTPSPVKANSPIAQQGKRGGGGSLKGSLGSLKDGKEPKKKRASYEWAKAFVSHRRISDDDYRICDDLVQGQGSQIRSAILRSLADVRALPRMDQVHVDTRTAGQVTVFISETQDIGTLIPSPDALADSLLTQATQPGSRLVRNLAGYVITSAARVVDPREAAARARKAALNGAAPMVRPMSLDTGGGALAKRGTLSRMKSILTGK